VGIECPDPAKLEDLLSSGRRFKLLPRADVLDEHDQRDRRLFQERHQEDGRRQYILQALDRGDLHTSIEEGDLDGRLTELFRMTRTAFEEGGSNVLFLILGFLKWTQKEGAPPCRARLLLIPASLQRSSVRAGFRLAIHEDEPRVNPTLLEMLRQDFRLEMPELEKELPTDQSGLDVARIWQVVRAHVRDLRGWEVTQEAVLSTVSFTKFLMWKDLVDRTDVLKGNSVVRHLIDTPKQAYGDLSDFPEARRLDVDHHPAEMFAPLSADSSQLAAVMAAASGKDFVLCGPPGTGKSQTIANMIAQCRANGKTVLFVSQKTAALEVVQRRLRDIGLGEYCLEVHSAKAQKSAVLGQLKTAWHERTMPNPGDWSVATEELKSLRDQLNALVIALHKRRGNGLTAYEAFGRVIAYRDHFREIRFSWPDEEHSEQHLAALRALCRELRTQAVGDLGEHPLAGIKTIEWTPAWRNEMGEAIDSLAADLPTLRSAVTSFANAIRLELAAGNYRTIRLLMALGHCLMKPEARPASRFLIANPADVRWALAELRKMQARAAKLQSHLEGAYRASIYRNDLPRILSEWVEATNTSFLVRGGRQKKVRQSLEPFVEGSVPADPGKDLAILIDLAVIERDLETVAPTLQALGLWAGLKTDAAQVEFLLDWSVKTREVIGALRSPTISTDALNKHVFRLMAERAHLFDQTGSARVAFNALQRAWASAQAAQERIDRLADRTKPTRPISIGPRWIDDTVSTVRRWQANLHRAQAWCNWNAVKARVTDAGLSPLTDALQDRKLGVEEIENAFEVAYARWWSDQVVTGDPVLRSFLATRHEDTIARFRAADERIGELSKRIVRARLSGQVPVPTVVSRKWWKFEEAA
jgi:hypothetical protein